MATPGCISAYPAPDCGVANTEFFKKCMLYSDRDHPINIFNKKTLLTAAVTVFLLVLAIDKCIDVADCRVTFILGSFLLYQAYYFLDGLLLSNVDKYKAIPSRAKQFYVVGNAIKSVTLASFVPSCVKLLYEGILCHQWNNTRIRNLGSLYAMGDFVSLLVVRRMAWSTILHHVAVVVFNIFSMRNDYNEENVCRLVLVYAIFSTFAYLVNTLLATRHLGIGPRTSVLLADAALLIYTLSCSLNWAFQIYYIWRLWSIKPDQWLFGYVLLIVFVIYDDVILNVWLFQNAHRTRQIYERNQSRKRQ